LSLQSTDLRSLRTHGITGPALLLAVLGAIAGCSASGTTPPPSRPDAQAVRAPERVDSEAAALDVPEGEVRQVPDAALVSHERAVAAMAADDWVEAELELEQLTVEYPTFPGPFVNLAIVYRHDGRDEEARGMLEQALGIDPQHAAANNQLGIMLREAGEFEAAEAAYHTAIAADPAYDLAYYNLGVLLDLYLRRGVEALEAYEKFQSLQAEPDAEVGRWIVDLRRRLGVEAAPERLAQEAGQ